jgi:hypothetical protein
MPSDSPCSCFGRCLMIPAGHKLHMCVLEHSGSLPLQAAVCQRQAQYSPGLGRDLGLTRPYFWYRFGHHSFGQELQQPPCIVQGCSNTASHPPCCKEHNAELFGIKIIASPDMPGQQQVAATRRLPVGHQLPYFGELISVDEVEIRYGTGFAPYCAPTMMEGFMADAAMYRCPASVVDHAPANHSNMEWVMQRSWPSKSMLSVEDLQRIQRHGVQWGGSSMRVKRAIGDGEVLLCCYVKQPAADASGRSSRDEDLMSSSHPHGIGKTVW